MTVTEFLTARLDEDEAVARDAKHPTDLYDSAAEAAYQRAANEGAPLRGLRHFNRWSPDRVLAEVEAKRRLIEHEWQMTVWEEQAREDVNRPMQSQAEIEAAGEFPYTLRYLALPFADHPDYDEAWRP